MIRTRLAVAAAVLGLCGLTAPAQTVYVSEPFSYPAPLNLAGQNGGTGFAGAWTQSSSGVINTSASGQTYANLTTSGSSVVTTGGESIYSRTIAAAAMPVGNDYWVSFLIQTNATAPNQYAGIDLGGNRYIGKASTDTFYGIAVTGQPADQSSSTVAPSGTAADLLVAHFRADNVIDLYVNPASLGGAAPGTVSATAALSSPILAGTALRLFSGAIDGASGPSSIFSDIRIGDSFAAVTPVPEPATVLALSAGALGLVRLRRRLV